MRNFAAKLHKISHCSVLAFLGLFLNEIENLQNAFSRRSEDIFFLYQHCT